MTSEEIIGSHLSHWTRLDDEERGRLLALADWLLAHKHWEAANGFALDDVIRTVIAAQAALVILGLTTDHYRLVSTIIVYPSVAVATGERAGPVAGTRTRGPMPIHGLAQDRRGPVLVAWDQARASARRPERGHNVVIHEFAHKIDMLDEVIDGTPPLPKDAVDRWVRTCTPIYEDLRAGVARPPLRSYGGTNPGEFFAVATEAFFDLAVRLRDNEPALYGLLRDFYRQDPATRAV